MQELLSNAFQTAKSQEALIKQVTESGHTPYFRNGKLTGIQFEGDRKYRFTTLGYTKEKVQELAQREDKDNKELDEIESIRNEADSIDRENESLSRTLDEIDDKGEHEPDSEKETENEYEQ